MSYNITHTEYVRGKLKIKRAEAARLKREHRDFLPEMNFLDDIDDDVGTPEDLVEIEVPSWNGEHSGHDYDFLPGILSCTRGKALILFVWEGGESQTGLEVDNGSVKTKKIKIATEDE